MACAYENVKQLIREDIVGHVQRLAPVFEGAMQDLTENHPSIKQYRNVGMFGCFDAHMPDGSEPPASKFVTYRKAFSDNGLIGLVRPPHLHLAPPLILSEDGLLDVFERNNKALYSLDDALGF
jgi:adenosylmethionine-8-amino-7-oxononanoate aminotransferase